MQYIGCLLYTSVTERCGQDYARVRIVDYHTNICRIEKNGTVMYEMPLLDETVQGNARADRSLLNMQDIWDFAETADLRDLSLIHIFRHRLRG